MSRYFTQLARYTGLNDPKPALERGDGAAAHSLAPLEQMSETIIPQATIDSIDLASVPQGLLSTAQTGEMDQIQEFSTVVPDHHALTLEQDEITDFPPTLKTQLQQTEFLDITESVEAEQVIISPLIRVATQAPRVDAAEEYFITSRANSSEKTDVAGATLHQEFFNETSDLLKNESTSAETVQQTYLREVREWVAAAPVTPEDVENIQSTTRTMPPRFDVNLEMPEPIEIVATSRTGERPSTSKQEAIEEQEYVVSIGAINVTVDVPSKPMPVSTSASSVPPERSFAALRRYYL